MKIVDRKAFLEMPANTLYAKYGHCYFDDLHIKGESIVGHEGELIDWFYQDIAGALATANSIEWTDKLFASHEGGTSIEMDFNCEGRDGCFDKEQLFAIYEKKDVVALIARLSETLVKQDK